MAKKNCPTCKESILSRTTSLIGETSCNPDCPQEFDCEDIYPSECIFYSGPNLSCSGVNFGDRINTAFAKIDAQLCSNQASNCLFKISSNDTCCGYFQTKVLAGNGITFAVANEAACETLTISSSCYTWNTFEASSASGDGRFRNSWRSLGGDYQPAQYSTPKECIVRLRGTVTVTPWNQATKLVVAVLPTGFRPSSLRVISTTVTTGGGAFYPAIITIVTSGIISVLTSAPPTDILNLYLDNLSFETV